MAMSGADRDCDEGELGIAEKHGLSNDVDRRIGEREAMRECLKRITEVSLNWQKMDERLARLEASNTQSDERMAAFVDQRLQGLLQWQIGAPEPTTPNDSMAPPEAWGPSDATKPPATLISTVEDPEEVHAKGGTGKGQLSRAEERKRRRELAAQMPHSTNFEFGESLYDAALFIGSPYMSRADSCLVALLLLVAVFVKVVFLGITYFVFASSPMFGPDYQDKLQTWRINVGHNVKYYDQLTMTSLVQRVCNADDYVTEISSGTSSLIGAIEEYMGENYLFGGPMLVKVAVLLWGLTVAREVMTCWDLARAVRVLPKGETSVSANDDGSSVRLSSISRPRSVWVFAICTFRIVASVFLWVLGNVFLCTFTISPGDILLNAVALEIVLTVAESMFVLVPSRVKRLLKSLDEMPAPSRVCTIARTDIRPFFLFVGLVVTIVVLEFTAIEEVDTRARGANETLCGGNQGFVYSMDPFYLVYTAESNPHNLSLDEIEKYAFREAINESIYPETMPLQPVDVEGTIVMAPVPMALEFQVNGLGPVEERSAWDMEQSAVGLMEHHGAACEDALHSLAFARRYVVESGLAFEEIDESVSVMGAMCADLLHMCQTWPLVRALCPVTCGCSEPLGALFLAHSKYGCPKGCTEEKHGEYRMALAEVECTERTPAELLVDSTWQSWAIQVGGEIDAVFRSEPQMKPHDNSTDMFLTMGCEVIPFWIDAAMVELDLVVDPCVGNWLEEWLETKPLAAACPITCGCNTKSLADEDWFSSHCSAKCVAP